MNRPSRKELLYIVVFFVVFLATNLLTATVFPIPWQDEVQFVDPAANLYFGNGFTSTAYRWEQITDFHAHHPLYSVVLAGWFEITSFGLLSARALNYILILVTAVGLWFSVQRTGLVPSPTYRLFLVLLLLFGYSVSFPYRTGRIEPLLMCLSAILFFLFTIRNRRLRMVLLGGLVLLFAPAGLQLVVFTGVVALLVACYCGRQLLPEVVVICLSLVIGVACLFALYAMHGVLNNALNGIGETTGGLGILFSGGTFDHRNRIPKDPSLMILLGLLAALLIDQIRRGQFRAGSALSFGAAISIVVPVVFISSAKFPTYYSWMVFVPLSVCLCATLAAMRPSPLTTAVRACLLLACVTGLPLQLLAVSYDRRDRNHAVAQQLAETNVESGDWVLSDHQAYFAVKPRAAGVFLPDYLGLLTADDKRKLTLFIGPEETIAKWRSIVGGKWEVAARGIRPAGPTILERLTGRDIDVGLIRQKYRFAIYRRVV